MPTFLHTADLHLDSAFSAHFDAKSAEKRRREMLRCVSDIISRAKDKDLLLIAGDLFDTANVTGETVAFLKRMFSEIPDTRVFISAGNHDPYTPDSVYAKEDFGSNVHIFKTELGCVYIPELKTRVWGASFDSSYCKIDIPPIKKETGICDILLLHGDLTLGEYNPIDKSFIENCGADYLALGHIHKRSEILKAGNTFYAYAGAPEGRGFDECGDMGVYCGSIQDGVVVAEFERTCIRRMFREEIDVTDRTDSLDIAETIKKAIFDFGGTKDDIYKIILKGRVETVNTDAIIEELSAVFYHIEIKDETEPCYDIEKLSGNNDLCGEFIRRMQKEIEKADDKKVLQDALILGIDALLGGGRV